MECQEPLSEHQASAYLKPSCFVQIHLYLEARVRLVLCGSLLFLFSSAAVLYVWLVVCMLGLWSHIVTKNAADFAIFMCISYFTSRRHNMHKMLSTSQGALVETLGKAQTCLYIMSGILLLPFPILQPGIPQPQLLALMLSCCRLGLCSVPLLLSGLGSRLAGLLDTAATANGVAKCA